MNCSLLLVWIALLGVASPVAAGKGYRRGLPAWRVAHPAQQVIEQARTSGLAGCQPETSQNYTLPRKLWSSKLIYSWSPVPAVSIGDHGNQVFVHDFPEDSVVLLSAFDADPPSFVWMAALGTEAWWPQLASANVNDIHVALDRRLRPEELVTPTLSKYTSSSSAPDWLYAFRTLKDGLVGVPMVDISRDGQVIVAACSFADTWDVEVVFFAPDSAVPRSRMVLAEPQGHLHGLDLSPDGTTLLLSRYSMSYLIDVATQSVVFATLGVAPWRQALAEKGRVFVLAESKVAYDYKPLLVYERALGSYAQVFSVQLPGKNVVQAALSDDGSTIASAWVDKLTLADSVVLAVDVSSQSRTMMRELEGPMGTWSYPMDMAISADGSRFALGGSGPAELGVYHRSRDEPLFEIDERTYVLDLDLSPDGQRLVALRAPDYGSPQAFSMEVDLFDMGGEDLFVHGVPSAQSEVTFELHGSPSSSALLLRARSAAPAPINMPGIGTLFLSPGSLAVQSIGEVPLSGVLFAPVVLPGVLGLVGESQYYQALTLQPRKLSTDWVKLTLLLSTY
jgi:hypothetical protein